MILRVDKLLVEVYESNEELGTAAAKDFAAIVRREVADHGAISVILATGNSQLTFLSALQQQNGIPWDVITVFHMDEYLGVPEDHPASFRRFLREKVVEIFHPRAMYGIQGDAEDVDAELLRYTELLQIYNPSVCVLGIGENGHLAFNDPPADFYTSKLIDVVSLDEVCRQQQVGEGHFPSIETVPKKAISLTVPSLLKPGHVMALVPEARKAAVVKVALCGTVTERCPASILRTIEHAKLYLDRESASSLDCL